MVPFEPFLLYSWTVVSSASSNSLLTWRHPMELKYYNACLAPYRGRQHFFNFFSCKLQLVTYKFGLRSERRKVRNKCASTRNRHLPYIPTRCSGNNKSDKSLEGSSFWLLSMHVRSCSAQDRFAQVGELSAFRISTCGYEDYSEFAEYISELIMEFPRRRTEIVRKRRIRQLIS